MQGMSDWRIRVNLKDVIKNVDVLAIRGDQDREVTGVANNSRDVRPGHLFVCRKGLVYDGHDFAPQAVSAGCSALVLERFLDRKTDVTQVMVKDSRRALAMISSEFFGHPSKRLRLIGVTGTNGKTTTTYLIRSILRRAGFQVGLVGTINYIVDNNPHPVSHTTPESVDLQRLFNQMLEAGASKVVMEVSSHALELQRVAGCEFDVAVFTNLSQDHLGEGEVHTDMEDYAEAKAKLFTGLGTSYAGEPKKGRKAAIINTDDPWSQVMVKGLKVPYLSYAIDGPADFTASGIEVGPRGVSFTAHTPEGEIRLNLKITARHNIYNSLAAVAVALTEGVDLDTVKDGLESIEGVAGRFESVDAGQGYAVVVDYAHSPDGLVNALQAARDITEGRVIVVFGAGGDRDNRKRPVMGKVASSIADVVIVTSDNPRSEDPEAIIEQIVAGIGDDTSYETEVDRSRAISRAVNMAEDGDIVLIAGKGHETYQIFREETIHFDDREVARGHIEQRLDREGRG